MEKEQKFKVGDEVAVNTMDGIVKGTITDITVYGEDTFYRVSSENGKMYSICKELFVTKSQDDRVNHPSHYQLSNGIEVLDIVKHMDFCLGNAIKYILRCSKKSEQGYTQKEKTVEDLKKAVFYINEKIQMLEEGDFV